MEVLSMNEKEWLKIIEECRASGNSIKSWCEQKGIKYSSYLYWAKKLNQQPQQWAQLQAPPTTRNEITICCGKWTIAVEDKVSLELLGDVLRVVNSVCC